MIVFIINRKLKSVVINWDLSRTTFGGKFSITLNLGAFLVKWCQHLRYPDSRGFPFGLFLLVGFNTATKRRRKPLSLSIRCCI